MMPETTFVYAPRSGSRFIPGAGPRREVAIPMVWWGNGCAHVLGAVVAIETAAPKRWWRTRARDVAAALAQRLGGVAWDENGKVHLAVTPERAEDALVTMLAASPEPLSFGLDDRHVQRRMILHALPARRAVRVTVPLAIAPAPSWQYEVRAEDEAVRVAFAQGGEGAQWVTVTAPVQWSSNMEIFGAWPIPGPEIVAPNAAIDPAEAAATLTAAYLAAQRGQSEADSG